MLIGNYSVINKSAGRFRSGSSVSGNRSNWNRHGDNRNFRAGWASVAGQSAKAALPNGYLAPYAYMLPQTAGGLGSRLLGSGDITPVTLIAGRGLTADLTGSGDITSASGQLIVSAAADLTGTGSISNAVILAALNGTADLTGTGTISTAPLTGKGNIGAGLSGAGAFTITAYAVGILSADIVIGAEPSTILDERIEGDLTLKESLRVLLAVSAGKTDVTGSTVKFRDTLDSKDRVTATISGQERTAVTLDLS